MCSIGRIPIAQSSQQLWHDKCETGNQWSGNVLTSQLELCLAGRYSRILLCCIGHVTVRDGFRNYQSRITDLPSTIGGRGRNFVAFRPPIRCRHYCSSDGQISTLKIYRPKLTNYQRPWCAIMEYSQYCILFFSFKPWLTGQRKFSHGIYRVISKSGRRCLESDNESLQLTSRQLTEVVNS